MRFIVKWVVSLSIIGIVGWVGWKWYNARGISSDALALIPADAIYCIATDDPIASWKKIADSEAWRHLQTNTYFASLSASVNNLDSIIRQNDLLFDLIGSRAMVVSAHMKAAKEYDFLFLVDLKEASGIKFLNDYLTSVAAAGYAVRKEVYDDNDLIVLHDMHDKSDLYLTMPGSFLLASYTKKIVTSALDTQRDSTSAQSAFITTNNDIGNSSLFRLYVNHTMLPQFMSCYSSGKNEYVDRLSRALYNTNLDVHLEGDVIKAEGFTSVNDSVESYVKTLAISGKGPTEVTEIAPQRTAFCLALGFTAFRDFFENFQKNIQQDVTEYNEYRDNMKQVESYLGIDLQENFINWIGDEVALIEMESAGGGVNREVALILKAENIEKARKDLEHIEKMIRKKTPVKFKNVDHRGYSISYLSMKGLFKVLLGKFFARYDKPYYTIINNFVIFSNHPQALESMIDDYLDKKTLIKSEEFRSFRKEFEDESSVFVYLNTPVLYNTIKSLADASTRTDMEANKEYIVCFQHAGFQLVPSAGGFNTLFAERFIAPEPKPQLAEAATEEPARDSTNAGETAVEIETVSETAALPDPMDLPYIYVQNLNASSYTGYFPDSTKHFEVDLRNGFKDGDFTEYYANGEVKMKGHFKSDKRDGAWRLYDESGELVLKRTYENGVITKEKDKD